ncbi:addiction module protein [Mycolicibacterium sp. XJ1819]
MADQNLWERMEQALFKRGVNTVLELVLWLALGYLIFGVIYTALHIELMGELESALSGDFTIFADLAALAVMVALWPVLLVSSHLCGVAGCGVF